MLPAIQPVETRAVNWIDNALQRIRQAFPTWRITDHGLLGLSAEWGKTFGGWRVTNEQLDRAIELTKNEWSRMPENITMAFKDILRRSEAIKNDPVGSYQKGTQERFYERFDALARELKVKEPGMSGLEIGKFIEKLISEAKKNNPDVVKKYKNQNGMEAFWDMRRELLQIAANAFVY
jgi:hypothetical protein